MADQNESAPAYAAAVSNKIEEKEKGRKWVLKTARAVDKERFGKKSRKESGT